MTRRLRVGAISVTVAAAGVRSASADPMGITGGLSLLALPLLFPLEGVIIAVLAGESSVRRHRFVPLWTALTLATFGLLLFLQWVLKPAIGTAGALGAGEGAVVLIEAYLIFVLLGNPRFVVNPKARPSFGLALGYSLLANLASLGGGALLLGLA